MGIITSTTRDFVLRDMKRLKLPSSQFFLVQGSDEVPAHKPDPKVFDNALQLLHQAGAEKNRVVYVGDALIDYYAARDAGIGFLGVTTGLVTKQEFEHAGAIARDTLSSLLPLILHKTGP